MRRLRARAWPVLLGLLLPAASFAQGPPAAEEAEKAWSFGAALTWYFVPDQGNRGVPTVTADHGPLHLELRYNYEALRTASVWVGWNFEFGETVTFGLTPIAGCMLGEAGGPALGVLVSIGWGPVSFSSQNEWVSDLKGGTGGFFYAWTELDVRPWEWLRAGVVAERTRVFHTAREVVFGPLIGVTVWKVGLSAYWFQPGGIDQYFVASVGVTF